MTVSQTMNDTRARARMGLVGDWCMLSHLNRAGFGINQDPQAAQVSTVTVADQGDGVTIVLTINSVDVTISTGTGLALAAIGALLAAAVNAEPLVRGQVAATFDTATLTLTGLTPGEAFTVSIASDPSSSLSAVTEVTAADDANAIPFGRAIVSQGFRSTEGERLVALADVSQFVPQVVTASIAYVASAVIRVKVMEVRGDERILLAEVSEASATDRDATIDALVALLNTALPATSVLVAADNATGTALVFTAEKDGLEFAVEVFAGHEGASLPAVTITETTGPSVATSLNRAFCGVSIYSTDDAAPTVGATAAEYAANAGVRYAQSGPVWVSNAEAVTEGGVVYVELAAGASAGKLYAATGSTRVALSRQLARWDRAGLVAADSLAAVRLAL